MYLILFSALLSVLAFNTGLGFLVFVSIAPFFLFLIYEKSLSKLLIGAFLFRLVFLIGVVYFVSDPILYLISIFIFLGLPLSFYLIRKYFSLLVAASFLPILWVVFDYLNARYAPLPMAITMLGSPLANSAFIGLAKIDGLISLTFFVALINLLVAFLILTKKNRKLLAGLMALVLILAGSLSYLFINNNRQKYLSRSKELNVALMAATKNRAEFDDLLTMIFFEKGTDLLVVPEDFYFNSNLEDFNKAFDFYSNVAKKINTNLSVIFPEKEGDKLYKSSVLFSGDGEIKSVYHKNYLTITSENWPFKNWRPFYFNTYIKSAPESEKRKAVFDVNYQYDSGSAGLLNGGEFSFVSPICVELHYPDYVKQLNGLNPDFILHNSGNDWIKRGLKQYLALTNNLRKIQSVQFGKPILVSGIKDYAGIFYPDGTSDLIYPEEDIVLFNAKVLY